MENLCVTRALKVLKHLQRAVPAGIPPHSLQGIASLPVKTLAKLHAVKDMHAVTNDPALVAFLSNIPIPVARASVPDALFRGTVFFVRVTFNRPGLPPFGVSAADVQTALNYATLAVKPIQRYASQYGINSIAVSPTIFSATLNLTGNTFSDDQIQSIVDRVIDDNHLSNAGIVILHDTSVSNGPTNTIFNNKFGGYHLMTGDGHPYCFCKVFGTNLTIADKGNVYAQILSHEIAEMVVDPKADLNNPEVADACAGNCNNDQFDLFDANGNFVGGTNKLSTAPPFAFFINSIIQPEFFDPDTECAVKTANTTAVCIYPPPPLWSVPGTLTTIGDIVSIAGHFSTGDHATWWLLEPNKGVFTKFSGSRRRRALKARTTSRWVLASTTSSRSARSTTAINNGTLSSSARRTATWRRSSGSPRRWALKDTMNCRSDLAPTALPQSLASTTRTSSDIWCSSEPRWGKCTRSSGKRTPSASKALTPCR